MFGAIAGGIASALAGGAMSKLFGGGQKAASGGIQGDVLATDNNTVGMGDAGIKIGRAVQQECRDRSRMPSSAGKTRRHRRQRFVFFMDRPAPRSTLLPYATLFRSGGIQGYVLATDKNTVGMGDAGI